jgi:DNA-binding transcriptional LysR family regulator
MPLLQGLPLYPLCFSETPASTAGVVSALLEDRIALGLIEGPAGRTDLKTEPFLEDEIVLVAPPSHEWVDAGTPVSPQALVHVPLLVREHGSGTRQIVEDAIAKAKVPRKGLRIAMELDSTEAIKSAVAAGPSCVSYLSMACGFTGTFSLSIARGPSRAVRQVRFCDSSAEEARRRDDSTFTRPA